LIDAAAVWVVICVVVHEQPTATQQPEHFRMYALDELLDVAIGGRRELVSDGMLGPRRDAEDCVWTDRGGGGDARQPRGASPTKKI